MNSKGVPPLYNRVSVIVIRLRQKLIINKLLISLFRKCSLLSSNENLYYSTVNYIIIILTVTRTAYTGEREREGGRRREIYVHWQVPRRPVDREKMTSSSSEDDVQT